MIALTLALVLQTQAEIGHELGRLSGSYFVTVGHCWPVLSDEAKEQFWLVYDDAREIAPKGSIEELFFEGMRKPVPRDQDSVKACNDIADEKVGEMNKLLDKLEKD